MGFPDRIERTVEIAHPPARVWAALTTAEGLGTWFGNAATIDLRPGGAARDDLDERRQGVDADRAGRGADGLRLHLAHLRPARRRPAPHLRRVHARADRRRHPADRRRDRASRSCRTTPTARPSTATPRAGRSELGELVAYLDARRGLTSRRRRAGLHRPGRPEPARHPGRAGRRAARPRPRTWPLACRSPGRRSPSTWRCWPRPGW